MAVKVNNTTNLRRAQRWDERDDAALCVLLKRKLKDIDVALRESESPYERARLKEQKKHYKSMLKKVESGSYNGDVIFGELQAASALRAEQDLRNAEYATMAGGKKYVNSYESMDFDYERAFRKKRYYGVGLPIVLLILSIVYVFIFIMGAFLPANIKQQVENQTGGGVVIDSLFSYKLGESTLDIQIANDGNWPAGIISSDKTVPEKGVPYENPETHVVPETVRLNADLGYVSVYISPFDVVKAWFRTPMLETTRLDFLEDSAPFQGESYYYLCFLSGGQREALIIQKDADGNYDNSVIIRHIGTYGTIMFLIIAFILGVINIVINIVRLFTYTSRRLHVVSILCFIMSLLCMISPALATVEGTELSASFNAYFASLTDQAALANNAEAIVGIGLLFVIPAIINLVMLILPLLFKNRLKKRVSYVPNGNKNRSAYNDPLYVDEETLKRLV